MPVCLHACVRACVHMYLCMRVSTRALQGPTYIAIVGLVSACRALDAGSRNPAEMIFEKLVSGMNLGEVNPSSRGKHQDPVQWRGVEHGPASRLERTAGRR